MLSILLVFCYSFGRTQNQDPDWRSVQSDIEWFPLGNNFFFGAEMHWNAADSTVRWGKLCFFKEKKGVLRRFQAIPYRYEARVYAPYKLEFGMIDLNMDGVLDLFVRKGYGGTDACAYYEIFISNKKALRFQQVQCKDEIVNPVFTGKKNRILMASCLENGSVTYFKIRNNRLIYWYSEKEK